jgi:hypothetical protein
MLIHGLEGLKQKRKMFGVDAYVEDAKAHREQRRIRDPE